MTFRFVWQYAPHEAESHPKLSHRAARRKAVWLRRHCVWRSVTVHTKRGSVKDQPSGTHAKRTNGKSTLDRLPQQLLRLHRWGSPRPWACGVSPCLGIHVARYAHPRFACVKVSRDSTRRLPRRPIKPCLPRDYIGQPQAKTSVTSTRQGASIYCSGSYHRQVPRMPAAQRQ